MHLEGQSYTDRSIDDRETEEYDESRDTSHTLSVTRRVNLHAKKVAATLDKPESELTTFDLMYPGYNK